jgi:hypothetical protein
MGKIFGHLNLMNILKKNWLAILSAACIGALLAFALGSTVLLRFKSEGLLSVELSVSEYKRITESLGVASDISSRLKDQPSLANDAEVLMDLFRNSSTKWHAPVARVSKTEAKDLPDAVLKLEFNADELQRPYSGVRLTAMTPDPQQSARVVSWLGEYLRDTAAKEILRQEIYDWKADNETFLSRAKEQRIRLGFEAEQSQLRAGALKKVLNQYPDLAKVEARSSVVDVRKDNEKFVSPGGQLIAAEVEVINHQASLTRMERQIVQANFMAPFLAASEKALRESNSGQDLVKRLSELVLQISKQVENDTQREALLGKAAKISEIAARFFSRAQFIVPPSSPERAEAPRPKMLAAFGGLLFGLLALLWVFRDWIIAALKENEDPHIKE